STRRGSPRRIGSSRSGPSPTGSRVASSPSRSDTKAGDPQRGIRRKIAPRGSNVASWGGMPNKGRPSKQHPDERKELEQETLSDPQPPKTIHRFDRSAEDEKGGTGAGVV